jgi:hypothetical protein
VFQPRGIVLDSLNIEQYWCLPHRVLKFLRNVHPPTSLAIVYAELISRIEPNTGVTKVYRHVELRHIQAPPQHEIIHGVRFLSSRSLGS